MQGIKNNMKIEKKSSIAYKLLFYVLFGNILVSLLFMLQNYLELSLENTERINRKIIEIKETIIPTLSANLYEENEDASKLSLKGILSDENIIRVSFLEPSNLKNPESTYDEIFYMEIKNFKKESPKSFFIKNIKIYHQEDIEDPKNYLGRLKVYFTKKYIQEKTRKQVISQSLVILFQTIMTTIMVFFIFKHLVTKHINTMVDYAINLDLRKIKALSDLKLKRRQLKSPDELDQLVNSINKMKKNIQFNHEKILDHSKNLEFKIREATKEINEEKNKIGNLMNNIQVSIFYLL